MQIDIVRGTEHHFRRAARDYWRAANQRQRWMSEGLSTTAELDRYDLLLVEEWMDRHEPMRIRLTDAASPEKAMQGLALLDWSHLNAPRELPPIRSTWSANCLVRGTYQVLAADKRVGWHPDFDTEIGDNDDGSNV